MNEAQIKHMVGRFLSWKLPANFNPDNGVSFEPVGNKGTAYEYRREPVGTNLLDADQAEAMVRHLLDGLPEDGAAATIVIHIDGAASVDISRMGGESPEQVKGELRAAPTNRSRLGR